MKFRKNHENNFEVPPQVVEGMEADRLSQDEGQKPDTSLPDFHIPEHVAGEIGNTGGNISPAGSLIAEPDASADKQISPIDLSPELRAWGESNINQALDYWHKYDGATPVNAGELIIPNTLDELRECINNFDKKFAYLCKAKQVMSVHEETKSRKTEDNFHISDTLDIVLVPWKFFRQEIAHRNDEPSPHLMYTLKELRSEQQLGTYATDHIDGLIIDSLRAGDVISYIDPRTGRRQSIDDYLHDRIENDGNWGMILAQNNRKPGIAPIEEDSPTLRRKDEQHSTELAGYNTGRIGIFERLALSLQIEAVNSDDHSTTLGGKLSLFPANYFDTDDASNPTTFHTKSPHLDLLKMFGKSDQPNQIRIGISCDDMPASAPGPSPNQSQNISTNPPNPRDVNLIRFDNRGQVLRIKVPLKPGEFKPTPQEIFKVIKKEQKRIKNEKRKKKP